MCKLSCLQSVSQPLTDPGRCYCLWENKARRDGKRKDNLIKYKALVDGGETRAPIGDRHPDFRFTL